VRGVRGGDSSRPLRLPSATAERPDGGEEADMSAAVAARRRCCECVWVARSLCDDGEEAEIKGSMISLKFTRETAFIYDMVLLFY
jgi:hypothetical protein